MLIALNALLWLATARAEPICTALADPDTGGVLRRAGACEQRLTPASTFKLALSLMGYDSGFLTSERAPALEFHEGYPDWIDSWKQTTTPATWMSNSVLWYSQQITQSLGAKRFQRYVTAFDYGNQDVSGDPGKNDGLSRAWLTSSLQISALEQLDFLRRIVKRELPVSAHAYDMTSRITALGSLPGGWQVHGKIGTGFAFNADGSADRSRQIGWFVGWASKGGRTVTFVRCIEQTSRAAVRAGIEARTSLMAELPSMLNLL